MGRLSFQDRRIIDADTKDRMKDLLTEIQSGEFARGWIQENKDNRPKFNAITEREEEHQIEEVGKKLREMMPFVNEVRKSRKKWWLVRKIDIFDTTLRDGEQAAGINLNTAEKIRNCTSVEKFGVTIIEAGFPASSPGDFEAVQRIANTVKNSTVTGLARAMKSDIDTFLGSVKTVLNNHIFMYF